MSGLLYAATLVTALGCGLVAGVFFTFSTFVMRALLELPPAQGMAAMQSINRSAISPFLMVALFGTALACLGLAVWAALSWDQPSSVWLVMGGVLYLVGAIAVTIACNVPLNDALAALDPGTADAAGHWARYASNWTTWNHVRGLAALGAAALLMVGLAGRVTGTGA
jgi:uncharacterized membrane protein